MDIRSILPNYMLQGAAALAYQLGAEPVVTLSDHRVSMRYETPGKQRKAWDPDLYHRGQVYYHGYANPIKPVIQYHEDLEEPDTIDVETHETEGEIHTKMISSPRYREYMRQNLIEQLLNPQKQWNLIFYALLGVAFLIVVDVVMTAGVAGIF